MRATPSLCADGFLSLYARTMSTKCAGSMNSGKQRRLCLDKNSSMYFNVSTTPSVVPKQ